MTRTLTYDRIKVLGLYETNKMFFSLSGPNLKRDKQPYIFFSVRLLSVLRGHSFFSSPPQWPMTSGFE